MSESNYPRMEGLEDRCLLSAHGAHVAPPLSHGTVIQATIVPLLHGAANGGAVGGQHWGERGHHQHAPTTIVTVDSVANTVTVSVTNRQGVATQTTYNVAPAATLTIDGVAATLDQFVAGINVKLQTDPTDPTTVTSMTAVGQQAQGKVTAIDTTAGTITLAGRGGASTTYTLDAGTIVTVNGQAGALAGIAVGFQVQIRLSALDGTMVVSVNAQGQLYNRVTVSSVDTVANTITVSKTNRDGTVTQTTLNVSPTAVITIDGQPGTLAQLVAGVNVSLQTDPMDANSIASIVAVGTEVRGLVSAVDTTAGTITLTDRSRTATTYTIGDKVPIQVNGQTGSLAGIAAGFRVELQLSALDGTTVTAVDASAGGQHGKIGGLGGPTTQGVSTQGGIGGQTTTGVGTIARGPGRGHRR